MTKYLPLLCCFFLSVQLIAQQTTPRCHADFIFEQNLKRFPELLENKAEIEAFTYDWIQAQQNRPTPRKVITIPIVVHVVWHKNHENISDLQIHSQIDALNVDFRAMNDNRDRIPEEFSPLVSDTEIEFCLATVDPNGFPTDGITRTQTDKELIGSIRSLSGKPMVCYTDLGGKNAWPPDKYLNIWLGSTGLVPLGKACKPGECPPQEDGVIIDPLAFGTTCNVVEPYHLGRTATHEIGHFLNLFHPWGTTNDDCESDDFVEDTPAQSTSYQGCPEHPQSSCESNDMFMNFMDYSDDICLAMFTPGQVMRMLAALDGPRASLQQSNGCGLYREIEPGLKIFPNPADDCLHIDLQYPFEKMVTFRIFDGVGRLISERQIFPDDIRSIDTRSLKIGIYVIHIKTEDSSFAQKLIIQRNAF